MLFPRTLTLLPLSYSNSIPPFHSVANAVGAAIANVSGEIDTIEILQGQKLPDVLERIKSLAVEKAVAAGAEPASVSIAEINILPVQV
jgi:hypothetical protein